MNFRTSATAIAFLLAGTVAGQSQGINGSAEFQAHQAELEKSYPQLNVVRDDYMHLSVPGYTMGETMGVATNSKGNLFVYSRTNPQGIARGGTAAMLWEFDPTGKFIKEWAPHNYAASFAHAVRVDREDNVWQVDEGSGMVVKYNPSGVPIEQFGRTPEAIDYREENGKKRGGGYEGEARNLGKPVDMVKQLHAVGGIGTFNRPTDV